MADSDDETFDQANAAAVLAAAAKSTGLERTGWMTKKGELRGLSECRGCVFVYVCAWYDKREGDVLYWMYTADNN